MSETTFDLSKCNVAICTPAYGGQLTTGYTNSLIQTIDLLKGNGVQVKPLFLNNESLVQRGRNTLVAQALADPNVTHVLFIDSDISWTAPSILRLLQKDVDIVGGIYPHKHYAWERLIQSEEFTKIQKELNAWKDLEQLQGRQITSQAFINKFRSFLLKFNIVFPRNATQAKIEQGFVQVERIATGMMLIKRKVFEEMMEKHPDWHYIPNTISTKQEVDRLSPFNYAFFDCKVDEHKQYLSEDWYFCSECKKLGGEVWADITMPLAHGGFHVFMGMVSDTLVSFSNRLESFKKSHESSNTLLNSKPISIQEEDPIQKLIQEAEQEQAPAPAPAEDDMVGTMQAKLEALRKEKEETSTQKESEEDLIRRILAQMKQQT